MVIDDVPECLAVTEAEGDDAGIAPEASDVDVHDTVVDQWTAAGSEISFAGVEVVVGPAAPEQFTALQVVTGEDALSSEGDDLAVGDRGSGERADGSGNLGTKGGGVTVAPAGTAVLNPKGFDEFLIADAVKEDSRVFRDNDSGETVPDGAFPEPARSAGGPVCGEWFVDGDPVAIWPEDLWPVPGCCDLHGDQEESGNRCRKWSRNRRPTDCHAWARGMVRWEETAGKVKWIGRCTRVFGPPSINPG